MKRSARKLIRNVEVKIREAAPSMTAEDSARIQALVASATAEKKEEELETAHVNG